MAASSEFTSTVMDFIQKQESQKRLVRHQAKL